MFLLRTLLKALKLLNSETSAASVAAGVALGMFLGLVPVLSLQFAVVFVVVLFLRVNLTAAIVGYAVFELLAAALWMSFDAIGVSLLDAPSLDGLWAGLYHSPLAGLRTNEAAVLGATLTATVLLLPMFFLVRVVVSAYRRHLSARVAGVDGEAGKASWLNRLYLWVDSPFGAP